MVLMILFLATLFFVMLIVSSFFIILSERENFKYFFTTTILCLIGCGVSRLFLASFYDTVMFTMEEIVARYDYKFIDFMSNVYMWLCVVMNTAYLFRWIWWKVRRIKTNT